MSVTRLSPRAVPSISIGLRKAVRWLRPSTESPLLDAVTIAAMAVIVLMVVAGPMFAPNVYISHIQDALEGPSPVHWFGTDEQGRDVLWRLVVGSRTTVPAALVVVGGYAIVGVVFGILSTTGPRWIREPFLRFIDVGLSVPGLVIALGIAASLGASIQTAVIALIVTGWPMTARILAGIIAETKTLGFVDGATVLGASRLRVVFRHVLPNALPVLWVKWAGDLGTTIVAIGGLSFIGAGAQPPSAEWGAMVSSGAGLFATAWWVAFFPGLAIALTSAVFAFFGDFLHLRINPEFADHIWRAQ